jgi:hypothetical protein
VAPNVGAISGATQNTSDAAVMLNRASRPSNRSWMIARGGTPPGLLPGSRENRPRRSRGSAGPVDRQRRQGRRRGEKHREGEPVGVDAHRQAGAGSILPVGRSMNRRRPRTASESEERVAPQSALHGSIQKTVINENIQPCFGAPLEAVSRSRASAALALKQSDASRRVLTEKLRDPARPLWRDARRPRGCARGRGCLRG